MHSNAVAHGFPSAVGKDKNCHSCNKTKLLVFFFFFSSFVSLYRSLFKLSITLFVLTKNFDGNNKFVETSAFPVWYANAKLSTEYTCNVLERHYSFFSQWHGLSWCIVDFHLQWVASQKEFLSGPSILSLWVSTHSFPQLCFLQLTLFMTVNLLMNNVDIIFHQQCFSFFHHVLVLIITN